MNARAVLALLLIAPLVSACAFQNKYEREAEKITRAVMNDDLRAVQGEVSPSISLNRARVAGWSDELNAQGRLLSVKERAQCDPGWHCFDVKFEKANYLERMRMDDQDKVSNWNFHVAPAG